MTQLKEVYHGFKNLVFKDIKVEPIAEERLAICYTCSARKDFRCGKCGCVLAAKTRSLKSKCPIGKW